MLSRWPFSSIVYRKVRLSGGHDGVEAATMLATVRRRVMRSIPRAQRRLAARAPETQFSCLFEVAHRHRARMLDPPPRVWPGRTRIFYRSGSPDIHADQNVSYLLLCPIHGIPHGFQPIFAAPPTGDLFENDLPALVGNVDEHSAHFPRLRPLICRVKRPLRSLPCRDFPVHRARLLNIEWRERCDSAARASRRRFIATSSRARGRRNNKSGADD